MTKFFAFMFTFMLGTPSMAQTKTIQDQYPTIFIYDTSGSMWAQMQGKTKIHWVDLFIKNYYREMVVEFLI